MKLLQVDTLEEARAKLKAALGGEKLKTEISELKRGAGRYLAENIYAGESVPAFARSTVDGYAVRASNTAGASESLPVFLRSVGEVELGKTAAVALADGQCAYVPTGGMLPEGADAMAMVEYCEHFSEDELAVYASMAVGDNVVAVGEDMGQGKLVLPRGTRLRPQEIGVLAALGVTRIPVCVPWSVTIISTGDELVDPGAEPALGQVRDINTYGLYSQAAAYGMEVRNCFVLKDEEGLLEETARRAMEDSDLVLISGGSSQGKKDVTCQVIDKLASQGVFTHGLALKPGKPTILGYDRPSGTLFMGLPGHPVAAMLVFELLAGWLWRDETGAKEPPAATAVISTNLPSAPGRRTCQLIQLEKNGPGLPKAVPILGKSGLIFTLSRADGYVEIPENQEGLKAGEQVEIHLLL